MSGFLLDTNVVSEGMKTVADAAIVNFLEGDGALHISVVTLHELRYGVEIIPAGRRKERLRMSIDALESQFADSVIPVDGPIAQTAAMMRAATRTQGRQLHLADALIAATAQTRALTLATRNLRDFDGCGPAVFNPWDAAL